MSTLVRPQMEAMQEGDRQELRSQPGGEGDQEKDVQMQRKWWGAQGIREPKDPNHRGNGVA